MAKKKASKVKKTIKRSVSKAVPVVTAKETGSPVKMIVIAAIIVVVALIAGLVYSQIRSAQLEKAAAAQAAVVPTAVPTLEAIKIFDPKTKKTYNMEVKQPSVSQNKPDQQAAAVAAAAAASAVPAAQAPPVAAPTSTDIKARCKIYFKPIDSKANIHRIDIEDAEYLYDSGAKVLFVDARGANEYEEAHIKGSVNIPVNTTPDEIAKMKSKLADKVLVTYCHGIGCHLSDKTAYLLYDAGYRKVAIFFGGWPKWNEHKYPITTKAPAAAQPAAAAVTTAAQK